MVPGITDTECRITQFRYRELQAEAARQRPSAQAAPIDDGRVGVAETLQRDIAQLVERAVGSCMLCPRERRRNHAAAPGALAVSK